MSIYDQLIEDDQFLRSLTNEAPNSSSTYDEAAFLRRFEQNLKQLNECQVPSMTQPSPGQQGD